MALEIDERMKNFIPYLLAYCDTKAAANAAGLSHELVGVWMRDPKFRAELTFWRRQLADRLLDRLARAVSGAVEKLSKIVEESAENKDVIKAAAILLDHYKQHYDQAEISMRLENLERQRR